MVVWVEGSLSTWVVACFCLEWIRMWEIFGENSER